MVEGKDSAPSLHQARCELAIAQRRKLDIEIEKLQRTLLPYDVVHGRFVQLADLLAGSLTALPARISPSVVDLSSRAECAEAIEGECDPLRTELARRVRDVEDNNQAGRGKCFPAQVPKGADRRHPRCADDQGTRRGRGASQDAGGPG